MDYDNFKKQLGEYLNLFVSEKINLMDYAKKNNIPIIINGQLEKGWRGNVIEHILNIPKNNKKESDYGFLEVKTVPYIIKENKIYIKETTCLSVINTKEMMNKEFEESSLYNKIKKTLFIFINVENDFHPYIGNFIFFNLDEFNELKNKIKNDYKLVADHIFDNLNSGNNEDYHFSGNLGEIIQPRPKTGKNKEYTWAFYLKKNAWNYIIDNNILYKKKKNGK